MDPSRQAWLLSKPVGIASEASSLGQNMTVNPGASMPTFATLPVLPPAPQPAPQLFWEPPAPLVTAGISPRNPLVLSALPGMSLVAENGSTALGTAVPLNIVQVGTPGRPVQPVHNANIVLTQVPLNCNGPGPQGGGVGHPASLIMATPAANTFINARIASTVQPQEGTWVLGPHPPTTQPVVPVVPVRSPVNSAPPTKGAYGESGPANGQNNSPENYSSKPDSVYGNFRRWQHIKTLVQRHLSQTPDVAAFSCFLIPVLRSLARRKPTMNVEEGLWRGLQEWQCTSNYDRMIFFEMAEKFTEFESAEEMENSRLEMENSRLEMMRGVQCQVLTTTTRQDPPRPPAPEVAEEPVCSSIKAVPKSDPAHLPVLRHQQLQKTEPPMEIPPEAVQEYMNIMDWLERLPQSFTGEPKEEEEESIRPKQEEDDLYSDAGLLDYIDELCSQKHFVEQVEAIINPQFVAEILSSKPEMDILALMKDLEYEEELTVKQLLEKHLALKKKGCKGAPLNPGAPQILANASVLTDCQGAKRDDHSPQRGASAQKCSSQMASSDHQCSGATNSEMWRPRPTVFPSSQCLPSVADIGSTVIPCGREAHPPNLGSRCAVSLRGVSATEEPYESLGRAAEDKEELPSLAFLLCSQYRLVPWKLAGHLCPYAGFSDSDSIPKPSSPKIRGLSPDASPIAKSKKRALIGGLTPMAKRSNSGPGHAMFEGPFSALELAHPLQAQKRKYESLGTRKRKRKKRH
nr:NUT family member 2-like isoform X1 [Peromyscus maniculatus bairdii]XP_042134399.1 NUT family member 2-like isoform X1 [Peromyscus maniculatus bairdii]XP_042134400.1 NUT family member 2-like isoform X1 [Peromyscus maniculatus bairdii]